MQSKPSRPIVSPSVMTQGVKKPSPVLVDPYEQRMCSARITRQTKSLFPVLGGLVPTTQAYKHMPLIYEHFNLLGRGMSNFPASSQHRKAFVPVPLVEEAIRPAQQGEKQSFSIVHDSRTTEPRARIPVAQARISFSSVEFGNEPTSSQGRSLESSSGIKSSQSFRVDSAAAFKDDSASTRS